MKDLPYKMKFVSDANFTIPKKEEKSEAFASILSENNDLSGLRAMLPSQAEIDENSDVLFFSANLAVANQINLNGDGVLTEGMISLAKTMKFKQLNIEHSREDGAVGCIISTGFSEFGTNKMLTEDEARAMRTPFNLCVTGVLWRVISDICDIVEASSIPGDENYQAVSLSWEIAFSEVAIADEKDLSKASLKYGHDAKQFKKYLRSEGGEGMGPNGKPCYRVALDCLGLGGGLVLYPAATVQGIITSETFASQEDTITEMVEAFVDPDIPEPEVDTSASILEENPELKVVELEKVEEIEASNTDFEKNSEKSENFISILEKEIVKTNVTNMKFSKQEEIVAHLESAEASIDAKALAAFYQSAMCKANDEYVAEQALKAEAEQKLVESLAKADLAASELNELKTRLAEMEASIRDKEIQEVFDARMTSLASEFNLEDSKVKAVVAKHIRELDEEGYAFWLENDGSVILASRKKESAPVDLTEATEALKEATASVDIPNAQNPADAPKPSLLDLSKDISFNVK